MKELVNNNGKMTNRDLAEKIYEDLNKRGADLGNASVGIIHKTLDDNGVKNCSTPLVSNNEVALKAFVKEYVEAFEDGQGSDTALYRQAKSLL